MVGCQAISHANDRQKLRCAGRGAGAPAPGSSNGVVFMTPDNEIGIAKIAVWPKVMAQIRKEAMGARLIEVEGRIQSGPEKKSCTWSPTARWTLAESVAARPRCALRKAGVALDSAVGEPLNDDRNDHPDHLAQKIRHPRDVRMLPVSRDLSHR